jgi:hypothetical protein
LITIQIEEGTARLVIQPSIARKLLKLGYKIIDIKPQKQIDGTTDFTRCVFLFEKQDGIDKDIGIIKSQR